MERVVAQFFHPSESKTGRTRVKTKNGSDPAQPSNLLDEHLGPDDKSMGGRRVADSIAVQTMGSTSVSRVAMQNLLNG